MPETLRPCLQTHLVNSKEIRKVSFTGSVATGKAIMAASANDVKRVTLELGGNDPAIIRADVDIAQVAPEVFSGAFSNTGQICCAIKRAYVHESIYDEFVAAIAAEAKAAAGAMGDGFDASTEFGPLNNEMQFTKVQGIVEDARAGGATIVTGGKVMDGAGKGYFYEPTIISDVMEGTRIVDEEQFGPVLPIIKYSDDEEALARANDSDLGLGGSVWSKDIAAANALANRIESGTVWVNQHLTMTGAPFGGYKSSGLGRELGGADVTAFTEPQTLMLAKSGKVPSASL